MIRIFGDCADFQKMCEMGFKVSGWTTNPTLMRKSKVGDYKKFCQKVVAAFPTHPVSFEVFADDFETMEAQARKISAWGTNVYVKIPVTTTKGYSCGPLISRLAASGVKVNVTAVFCQDQIDEVFDALNTTAAIVSIFAGRIADTGRAPEAIINYALKKKDSPTHEILWASPRQVMDVYVADSMGCDIITCTPEIIDKIALEGKNLKEYSRETIQMFYDDATKAGYSI